MTNQQDLRERIRRPILKLINDIEDATKRSPFEGDADEWAEDVVSEILALISPPDPGLASLVGEIDGLFEEATPAPWKHHREQGPYTYRDEIWCDSPCKDEPEWLSPIFDEIPNKEDAHLVVALVNNWPAIRAALTTGGSGWRDSQAVQDVVTERQRQIEKEGWTPEHDDQHSDGALADAGACYAMSERAVALVDDLFLSATNQKRFSEHPYEWPFDAEWWKPKDRRRNLVRAGALILAEIERLDRLPPEPETGGG